VTRDRIAGVLAAKEDLENLVEWARRLGVTRVKVGGLELELGPLPATSLPGEEPTKEAIREAERLRRIGETREALETEWAHVGGVSHLPDEEIERYIRGEGPIFGRAS